MSYTSYTEAISMGLDSILMYNRAGKLVGPDPVTIQSAMEDNNNATSYTIDLFDSPGMFAPYQPVASA